MHDGARNWTTGGYADSRMSQQAILYFLKHN